MMLRIPMRRASYGRKKPIANSFSRLPLRIGSTAGRKGCTLDSQVENGIKISLMAHIGLFVPF
jgi:hypothetical protein